MLNCVNWYSTTMDYWYKIQKINFVWSETIDISLENYVWLFVIMCN